MDKPRIRHTSSRLRSIRSGGLDGFHVKEIGTKLYKKYTGKKNIILQIIGFLLILFVLGALIAWGIFLRGIPPIENLATGNYFRENTVIYDKNGAVIYTLFKDGRRTYVSYDDISQSIKDAIISTEDRTFFTNPGIDLMGLVRVAGTYVTGGKYGSLGGASTISQQLIKNTLLTSEHSVKRKVQEAYLSYQLNKNYSKEKILEMYLNAFSFGYNANGVEEASRTYFGKSAKDVGPLGASILASLPKGPTQYSPYNRRDRLMGKLEVYPNDDTSNKKIIIKPEDRKLYADLYNPLKSYLSGMTMERSDNGLNICHLVAENIKNRTYVPDSDGCVQLDFNSTLDFLGNIALSRVISTPEGSGSYTIEYTIGRKDFVAAQMLEDGKIDGPTFKKIVYDGLEFEFRKYSEKIKYPYFVMYVKEYLETKYGKDIDVNNGLKIYTTIDPRLQDAAEEAVKKQVLINKAQFGARSAALISMSNIDGSLLAMVGGPDYFDSENGGNNNMTTALRQPGSSFKPIVYALAISKNPLSALSPVADVRTLFGKWSPNNYDGKFLGIMTVEMALSYSRNIPAAKMYYLAGQGEAIAKHARSLGIASLKENGTYDATMSLGSFEVRPIEMMQAYSVFANNGIRKPLYFIEKIEDDGGNIIEEHKAQESEAVFSPGASYIMATILSNEEARPESSFWRTALALPGRKAAVKTGTSNKVMKNGTILPRDLWTIGFTPQITTAVWAGNLDGKETKGNCDGLNCAAPIWKSYMITAHKDLPREEFKKPKDIYSYEISKVTGLLAGKNTPDDMRRSVLMATQLESYDDGGQAIEIDTLCNGLATEETPEDSRLTIYKPTAKPIIDGYDPDWYSGFLGASRASGSGVTSEIKNEPCTRPKTPGNVSLSYAPINLSTTSPIRISWNGNRMISKIVISNDGTAVNTITIGSGGQTSGVQEITLGSTFTPIITAYDVYGYSYVGILGSSIDTTPPAAADTGATTSPSTPTEQKTPPSISMINPRSSSLNLYPDSVFNLRFQARVSTPIREIIVLIDNKVVQSSTSGELFVFPMSTAGLAVGKHSVTINVKDGNLLSTNKSFTLNILPR